MKEPRLGLADCLFRVYGVRRDSVNSESALRWSRCWDTILGTSENALWATVIPDFSNDKEEE